MAILPLAGALSRRVADGTRWLRGRRETAGLRGSLGHPGVETGLPEGSLALRWRWAVYWVVRSGFPVQLHPANRLLIAPRPATPPLRSYKSTFDDS